MKEKASTTTPTKTPHTKGDMKEEREKTRHAKPQTWEKTNHTDTHPQATKSDQHGERKTRHEVHVFYLLTNKTKPAHLRENEKTRR